MLPVSLSKSWPMPKRIKTLIFLVLSNFFFIILRVNGEFKLPKFLHFSEKNYCNKDTLKLNFQM